MTFVDCNGLDATPELQHAIQSNACAVIDALLQQSIGHRHFVLLRCPTRRLSGTLQLRNSGELWLIQENACGNDTQTRIIPDEVEMVARCLSKEEVASKNAAFRHPCTDSSSLLP